MMFAHASHRVTTDAADTTDAGGARGAGGERRASPARMLIYVRLFAGAISPGFPAAPKINTPL